MDAQHTLVRIYLFGCQYYRGRLAATVQRQSNNDQQDFTDEEVLAVYLFGLFKKRETVSDIQVYAEDHFSDWFSDLPSYQSQWCEVVFGKDASRPMCRWMRPASSQRQGPSHVLGAFYTKERPFWRPSVLAGRKWPEPPVRSTEIYRTRPPFVGLRQDKFRSFRERGSPGGHFLKAGDRPSGDLWRLIRGGSFEQTTSHCCIRAIIGV